MAPLTYCVQLCCTAVVYCPDPSMPNNGFRNSTSTRFGSTVEYNCALGFEMLGNSTRTCKEDGTWSGSMPICQLASCPDPGIPPNSQRQLTALTVGSYITYSCVPGYRLVGAPHILCLMSREWSALPPRCACKLRLTYSSYVLLHMSPYACDAWR